MGISVGIVGHRGYSGADLLRILNRHPHVEPVLLDHREDPGDHPKLRKAAPHRRAALNATSVASEKLAAVFLATPPEVSMDLAPGMLEAGAKVIDLSGAFRLQTPERYLHWYKAAHTQPALLAEAVYGLPEFCRERIPGARLISNPGCYPTAANLAIRPLVEAGVIDRAAGVICDAKSGVSGAGRKASLKTSFCEVTENLSAYSMLDHRHVPGSAADLRARGARVQLHGATAAHRSRHSRNYLFPLQRIEERRRPDGDLRAPVRRGAVHPPVRTRPLPRSSRRGADELLRHRNGFRCVHRSRR